MPKNTYFKIIKGTNPILLSAPHALSHRRPSLTLSYKLAEPWTDDIVEQVCANTGAWGIVVVDESEYDPNYYCLKENPYKQELANLIHESRIKKFIDIHGLSDDNDFDVGIYYPSRFSKSIVLANSISECIGRNNLRGINSCIFRFEEGPQETLGEFVASKLRVPSIQIEVARYIREKELLRNAFISNLSEVLRV